METKYYKVDDRYIKVVNENSVCCVWDNTECPEINYNLVPKAYQLPENVIHWSEFSEAFEKVHQLLKNSLLNIEYNNGFKLTNRIAQLVRSYDANAKYIDDGGQLRIQEEKNDKIMAELKDLGVKSFEGINVL